MRKIKVGFFSLSHHSVTGDDRGYLEWHQLDHMPEIRSAMGENLQVARSELASIFLHQERSAISKQTAGTIGKFLHVLLSGLIMQWMIDPEHALSAHDLTHSLLAITAAIEPTPAKHSVKRPPAKPSRRN